MKIYKDKGYGVTESSLNFWKRHKNEIGKIKTVEIDDAIEPHNMKITGSEGEIWLSGCSCGYWGTGPHGTFKILLELGTDKELAEREIQTKRKICYDVETKVATSHPRKY